MPDKAPAEEAHQPVLPQVLNERQARDIYIRLERISTQLSQVLGMKTDIDSLGGRITVLETASAVSASRRDIWARVVDGLWAVLLAVIATGVWWNHPT